MAIAYKGFEMWIAERDGTPIQYIRNVVFSIVDVPASYPSNLRRVQPAVAAATIDSLTPERERLACFGFYQSEASYHGMLALLPLATADYSRSMSAYAGKYIKLLHPGSGNYAISNSAISSIGSLPSSHFSIYFQDGRSAGSQYLQVGISDTTAFFGIVDFDGENIPTTGQMLGFAVYYSQSSGLFELFVTVNSQALNLTADYAAWWNAITPIVEDTDPYSGIDGESDIPGGSSISVPGFPPATATATGIVGLFAPSEAQMQALADYMWTDFGGTGTTTEEILEEIVQALKRSISNPLDYVIGLNIIPSQGLSIGASQVIRFGYVSTGVSMPRLSSQYFAVDCGTLHFNPLCGDTFLDYAPYSKFSIYLPYIGARELDANDCVGHTIGVVYHGDAVTGGVTAYVTKDGTVMYQFSGSCALSIPLSSDGWGSTISAAVQIATTIATAGASAGSAGVAKAAAQGAASVAANPSLLSPQVAHSGAVSGAAGCMGIQYPYIIREAVRFHSTAHFNTLTGYPSFYFRELSEVSGYTRVLDVHLSGVPATLDEISEIETLLKEGVEL